MNRVYLVGYKRIRENIGDFNAFRSGRSGRSGPNFSPVSCHPLWIKKKKRSRYLTKNRKCAQYTWVTRVQPMQPASLWPLPLSRWINTTMRISPIDKNHSLFSILPYSPRLGFVGMRSNGLLTTECEVMVGAPRFLLPSMTNPISHLDILFLERLF